MTQIIAARGGVFKFLFIVFTCYLLPPTFLLLLFAVTFLLFKLSHDDFGIEENPPSCVETKCVNININFTFEGEEEGFSSEGEEEKSFSTISFLSFLYCYSPNFSTIKRACKRLWALVSTRKRTSSYPSIIVDERQCNLTATCFSVY